MIDDETKTFVKEEIADALKFGTPLYGDTPTDALQLVPKKYVDGVKMTIAAQGFSSIIGNVVLAATGISESGQTITFADPSALLKSFIASESISQFAPVAPAFYQTSQIGFDTSAASATTTTSITVASNSNRILAVLGIASGSVTTTATYNGVSMNVTNSNFTSGGNPFNAFGAFLAAPATGTHNLVIGGGGLQKLAYFSLYNCNQTNNAFDALASTSAVGTAISKSIQSGNADGAMGIGFLLNNGGTSNMGTPIGNIYFANTGSGTNQGFAFGNSDPTFISSAGTTFTIATTGASSQSLFAVAATITPFNSPVAGVQNASSASGTYFRNSFIGFAETAVSAGQSVNVALNGVVTLSPPKLLGNLYYLNDTNGTIGTSVGTVSVKVGVAVSDSALLITNVY